jgi:hypothetical protein
MTSCGDTHAAIDSLFVSPTASPDAGTVQLAREAARACLAAAATGMDGFDTLLFAGTYRTRMLSEPAVAAVVAGELAENGQRRRLLAFDVIDGPASMLRAWFVAAQLLRAGKTRSVLVVAAESPGTVGLRLPPGHGVTASAAACLLSRRCCDDPSSTTPVVGSFTETPLGLDRHALSAAAGSQGLLTAVGTTPTPQGNGFVDLPYGTAMAYAVARAASPSGWRKGLATAALPRTAEAVELRERSGTGWLAARFGDLPVHTTVEAAWPSRAARSAASAAAAGL